MNSRTEIFKSKTMELSENIDERVYQRATEAYAKVMLIEAHLSSIRLECLMDDKKERIAI